MAGVCELMARVVTDLTSHEAATLSKGPGKHSWYLRDPVKFKRWAIGDREQVRAAIEWADVIACQANVGARNLGVIDLLKKKRWCFRWHGCEQKGCLARSFKPEDYKYVGFSHIGQGWVAKQAAFFEPFFRDYGARVVPNIVADYDELHTPLEWSKRKPGWVGFAPSTMKPGAPNKKGVPEVQRASKGQAWTLDLISGASFEKCLRRKRRCEIGIDEVVTGMYHRSALEFLSQGTPCIVNVGEDARRCLTEEVGADTVPFVHATPDTLRSVINTFFELPRDVREDGGREARLWVERNYSAERLLPRFLDVYNS